VLIIATSIRRSVNLKEIGQFQFPYLTRLGGYLARAKDPPPGNTVMWRGVSRLTDIELGFVMGAQLVGN